MSAILRCSSLWRRSSRARAASRVRESGCKMLPRCVRGGSSVEALDGRRVQADAGVGRAGAVRRSGLRAGSSSSGPLAPVPECGAAAAVVQPRPGGCAMAITQIHTHRRNRHGSCRDGEGGALDASRPSRFAGRL